MFVRSVNVIDGQDGEGRLVSGISESDSDAGSQSEDLDILSRDVECDRDGEETTLALSVVSLESESVSDAEARV